MQASCREGLGQLEEKICAVEVMNYAMMGVPQGTLTANCHRPVNYTPKHYEYAAFLLNNDQFVMNNVNLGINRDKFIPGSMRILLGGGGGGGSGGRKRSGSDRAGSAGSPGEVIFLEAKGFDPDMPCITIKLGKRGNAGPGSQGPDANGDKCQQGSNGFASQVICGGITVTASGGQRGSNHCGNQLGEPAKYPSNWKPHGFYSFSPGSAVYIHQYAGNNNMWSIDSKNFSGRTQGWVGAGGRGGDAGENPGRDGGDGFVLFFGMNFSKLD